MALLLPLLALAIAIAALFAASPRPIPAGGVARTGFVPGGIHAALAALLALALAGALIWGGAVVGARDAVVGLALGLLLAVLAHAFEARGSLLGAAPLALAAAVAGFLHLLSPEGLLPAQLAAVFGAAAGAWALGVADRDALGESPRAALFLAAIVACDALAREALTAATGAQTGTAFGLAAAVVALVVALVAPRLGERRDLGVLALALLGLLAVGWLVGARFAHLNDAFLIFGGGIVAALVVHLLLPLEERPDGLRFVLAVIIWIGLATWAFSLRRGFGMSVGLLGAGSLLLLLGNTRALLSMGPLLALVYYRIFRESHVEATRALDIGQHYAMIGIALGAILPLLPLEWARERRSEIAAALWILLLAALPVVAAIILGPRGAIGVLAGLGLAALVEGLRGERALTVLPVSAAIAAATALTYGNLGNLLEMTREGKIQALIWIAPGIVLVGIAIALLSRPAPEPLAPARLAEGEA